METCGQNNRGSRTEPWGTPDFKAAEDELENYINATPKETVKHVQNAHCIY